MSTTAAVLAVIATLVTLAGVAFAAWQLLKAADREARIKRLQNERDDYLSRLNYIEPRHRAIEQQNEVLLALHNPTDKLEDLAERQADMLRILRGIKTLAEQIDRRLYAPPREKE